VAAVLGWIVALFREFRGASDLILARVKPLRRWLNDPRTKIAWGVLTAVSGLTACVMWSPVWLGIYISSITLFVYLEPFFQTAAAVTAPFVMTYTRVERVAVFAYCYLILPPIHLISSLWASIPHSETAGPQPDDPESEAATSAKSAAAPEEGIAIG
jgi:hypothetical protein